jgi:hypothetical protein
MSPSGSRGLPSIWASSPNPRSGLSGNNGKGTHVAGIRWPWQVIVQNARQNEPDRFEVAVWSRVTLCGLAIGWTRNAFCRVDYLEGFPPRTILSREARRRS